LRGPRPAVPQRGSEWGARRDEGGPSAGVAAAGIAVGVLCLWTPFTLIVAVVLATLPECAGSAAGICTAWGHFAAMWSDTAGALVGLLIVVVGAYVYPRRHHAVFALGGLATALAGLLVTVALVDTTPGGWVPK